VHGRPAVEVADCGRTADVFIYAAGHGRRCERRPQSRPDSEVRRNGRSGIDTGGIYAGIVRRLLHRSENPGGGAYDDARAADAPARSQAAVTGRSGGPQGPVLAAAGPMTNTVLPGTRSGTP